MKQFLIKIKSILLSRNLSKVFTKAMLWCVLLYMFLVLPGYLKEYVPGFVGGLVLCGSVVFVGCLFSVALLKVAGLVLLNITVTQDAVCCLWKRKLDQYVFIPMLNVAGILATITMVAVTIPHMYASWELEPLWRRWVESCDEHLWRQRDEALKAIGFDSQTSLRHWEHNVPGIYLPDVYIRILGFN